MLVTMKKRYVKRILNKSGPSNETCGAPIISDHYTYIQILSFVAD